MRGERAACGVRNDAPEHVGIQACFLHMIRAGLRRARVLQAGARRYSSLDDALLYSKPRKSPASFAPSSEVTSNACASAATARLTVRAAVSPSVLTMARAAGALGAKNAASVIPMLMPKRLESISVEIHADVQNEVPAERPAPPPAPSVSPNASAPRERGGFTTESLLDPDVWMDAHQEHAVPERVTEPRAVSRAAPGTVTVHSRVSAEGGAPTEAIAACMAAALSIMEAVGTDAAELETVHAS